MNEIDSKNREKEKNCARPDLTDALFGCPGYVSLGAYVADIDRMKRLGPWKLPFGIRDRIRFAFLAFVARFSWFSDVLYIKHPHSWSPAYAVLVAYLQRHDCLGRIEEKKTCMSGYNNFLLSKGILLNNGRIITQYGNGIHKDKATAFSIALGEIIERMVSGLYDQNKNILSASPEEMMRRGQPLLYPPRYHRFLDVQKQCYRELQHDPTNTMDWMEGKDLITSEKAYLPRQITSWFGFRTARVIKDILVNASSSGCAGYFSMDGAVVRALLETVNRDAYMVHWLTMTAPRVITKESLPEDIQETIQELESRGVSISVLDVTALSIPSVYIAAVSEQSALPRIALSGASDTDFEEAIRSALKEAISMVSRVFYRDETLHTVEKPHEDVEPFIADLYLGERYEYWKGRDRLEQFRWFISGPAVSLDELRTGNLACANDDSGRLRACLAVLKNFGPEYHPIVYFPKHPIQQKLGFFVSQVYIPKAFPIYLHEGHGTFESDRLDEFARSKKKTKWQINPLPHPFA